ncbi:hypothetical protein SERLADRAFT_480148 [Serpula lacrymans var. lacrymans S7.9]|uniref:Uncharacterized protein n=1 Tax=Serpula lacrymans var. lacrymans (strain S7.9) TaxID=578457 RepID=F8PCR4_SERL9|nr:uncharacterized protein SERLADRAFT_480148 [Serpula lacrymans var. lacrymans S7.9]EGO19013.1 hypothetical protein SERLADRAFT_480148 [Serpula lacrymans var. lacrymans S7.9]
MGDLVGSEWRHSGRCVRLREIRVIYVGGSARDIWYRRWPQRCIVQRNDRKAGICIAMLLGRFASERQLKLARRGRNTSIYTIVMG